MTDDVEPACADIVDNAVRAPDWRPAKAGDLDTRRPCRMCFPDADGVVDIERPLDELVVARKNGSTVHRHRDGEAPNTDCFASTGDKSLHNRLANPDFGPEDLGLSGGDA